MYAAISYESLGHAAHLYSNNKIIFLTKAVDHFAGADAALPAPILLSRLSEDQELSPPDTPGTIQKGIDLCGASAVPELPVEPGSTVQGILQMIDSALFQLDDDPFFSDDETDYQQPFVRALVDLASSPRVQSGQSGVSLSPSRIPIPTQDPVKKGSLVPPPLRVSKMSQLTTSRSKMTLGLAGVGDKDGQEPPGRYRPPRLPLKIIPATQLNMKPISRVAKPDKSLPPVPLVPLPSLTPTDPTTDPVKEYRIPTGLEGIDPAQAARIIRSNRGIVLLHELIAANIVDIHQQIDRVTEIQRTRRARTMQRTASFWSFHPIQPDESVATPEPSLDEFGNILMKESRDQRIARLRAEGWNTVGLRSPRRTWKGARYYQEFCAMVLTELHLDG